MEGPRLEGFIIPPSKQWLCIEKLQNISHQKLSLQKVSLSRKRSFGKEPYQKMGYILWADSSYFRLVWPDHLSLEDHRKVKTVTSDRWMKGEYCEEISSHFLTTWEAWEKHKNLAIFFCINDVHLLSHRTGLSNSCQKWVAPTVEDFSGGTIA